MKTVDTTNNIWVTLLWLGALVRCENVLLIWLSVDLREWVRFRNRFRVVSVIVRRTRPKRWTVRQMSVFSTTMVQNGKINVKKKSMWFSTDAKSIHCGTNVHTCMVTVLQIKINSLILVQCKLKTYFLKLIYKYNYYVLFVHKIHVWNFFLNYFML